MGGCLDGRAKKSGYVRKMVGRWKGTISGTRHMISEEGGMVWL